REAAADAPGDQRIEPGTLLLGGAVLVQDLHVAHVRRLAVEGVVSEWSASELLADEGKLEQGQPHAAELAVEEGRPPATLSDLGPDALQLGLERAPAFGHPLLQRLDALGDEGADSGEEAGDAGGDAEVHDEDA